MRFKIPANTEIEDRILPFLTIRQLIILSIGGVICYMIFQIFFSMGYIPAVWGTIDFIVGGLFAAAAFLKINHLEFHRWIMLLISKLFVPQKRFFNNGLIGGQYFDVLNITTGTKKVDNSKKGLDKAAKLEKIKIEEKNNLDEMKNQIFGNENKNFDFFGEKNNNYNDDFEDEISEFNKRFG